MSLHLIVAAGLLACDSYAAPLIAAHRGGMDSGHPENTIPAFRQAAAVGAAIIELDLRTTRDGHLVVLHDPTVDRTTDGRGAVHRLDLDAIRRLDAGNGVRVPTLLETLEAVRPLNVDLLLDLKTGPGLNHELLARAVAEYPQPERVVFGVRSLHDYRALRARLPAARFLGFVKNPDAIAEFLAAGIDAIRAWPRWLDRDPGLIARVHDTGARVWVTAGAASVRELADLAALGVDAVLTDRPADASAAFGCAG